MAKLTAVGNLSTFCVTGLDPSSPPCDQRTSKKKVPATIRRPLFPGAIMAIDMFFEIGGSIIGNPQTGKRKHHIPKSRLCRLYSLRSNSINLRNKAETATVKRCRNIDNPYIQGSVVNE
jgi:hypothetical protein